MPVKKFGTSLGKSGAEPYYQWSGLLRNVVRSNAICMGAVALTQSRARLDT